MTKLAIRQNKTPSTHRIAFRRGIPETGRPDPCYGCPHRTTSLDIIYTSALIEFENSGQHSRQVGSFRADRSMVAGRATRLKLASSWAVRSRRRDGRDAATPTTFQTPRTGFSGCQTREGARHLFLRDKFLLKACNAGIGCKCTVEYSIGAFRWCSKPHCQILSAFSATCYD